MFLRLKKLSCEKKQNIRGFTKPTKMAGFSLIELMVSLTIFSILMVVSVGTLLTLIDANAKAQALSSATTNLSFALDSITREIRTGHYYNCRDASTEETASLPTGFDASFSHDCNGMNSTNPKGNEIIFIRDRDGFKIAYRLFNKKIQQKVQNSSGTDILEWEDITSSDTEIETFDIVVGDSTVYGTNGAGPGAQDQPVVTLHIKGKVKDNNGLETKTDFNIQTVIVQRRLDQV